MLSINKVMLCGNLTRDCETKTTNGGLAIAEFGLAVNRKMKDKDETCFVNVTVFGKQADACGKYLAKGSSVYVEGRLVYESWEDRSGAKRNTLKVVADAVQFVSGRESASGRTETSDRNAPPPNRPTVQADNCGHKYSADDCRRPDDDDNGELPPF